MPAAGAAAVKRALAVDHGAPIDLGGEPWHAFPTPAALLRLRHVAGLPVEKVRRLQAVADAARSGLLDAPALAALEPDEALARLKAVHGIGDFSATLILLRAAGVTDVLPSSEPRFLAAAAALAGRTVPLTPDELAALTAPWSPFRTWIAFLLRATT
jgi:DNA-3-methyladenine glycosylase II